MSGLLSRAEREVAEADRLLRAQRRRLDRLFAAGAVVALCGFASWYAWTAWNRGFLMQRTQDRLDALEARLETAERRVEAQEARLDYLEDAMTRLIVGRITAPERGR